MIANILSILAVILLMASLKGLFSNHKAIYTISLILSIVSVLFIFINPVLSFCYHLY